MIRIILDHNKLTQDEFKAQLEYIFKKMDGNATYSMLQAVVTVLGGMIKPYSDALFVAKEGGDVTEKNKLRASGDLFLTKLARKIEVIANDMEDGEQAIAFVKGTGFTMRQSNAKKNVTFLEVPNNFYAADDKKRKGACLLTWDAVVGALTYLIYELDKDGNWQSRGVSKKTSLLIEGTAYEVKKTFRICAAGAGTLVSDYTEPMSVWVH